MALNHPHPHYLALYLPIVNHFRNTVVAGRCDGILDIIEVKRHQLDSVEDFVMGDNSPGVNEKRADCFGCHIKHRIRSHIGPIEHVAVFAGLVLTAAADMIKVCCQIYV